MDETPADLERARRRAFDAENLPLCARGGRALGALLIAIAVPFGFVDWARFPTQGAQLIWLRGLTVALALAEVIVLGTTWGRRRPREVVLAWSAMGGVITLAMMSVTGGHASAYFSGMGLLMLTTALVMPWPAVWTWLTCGVVIALYLVYTAALAPWDDGRMFANNLFSYLATAMIAGFATTGRERLRWREFLSRHALEESRLRLEEKSATWESLAHAGREMIASLERPRILDRLCHLTAELMHCDYSHALLRDLTTDLWQAVAQHGDSPEQWKTLRAVELPSSAVAAIVDRLRRHEIVRLDLTQEGSFPTPVLRESGMTSTTVVGLHRGDELVGALTAGFRGSPALSSAEQDRLLTGLAQLASMALTNASLHEELGRQTAAERAARAELEAASNAKDEFVATLSHELRTPLNVILGFAEMARDPSELEHRDELVAGIEEAGRKLLDMIDDTLEINRLQTGHSRPATEHVSLAELWKELQRHCSVQPRKPEVALRWLGEPPDAVIQTDRRKLLVTLRNLVNNGLKFTERGAVEVSFELGADAVVFRVADTGIGIADEDCERIFEMFQQLDGSDTRRYGGVGLGLHIARRFSEQLGGTIELQSQLHVGSVFTVRLPRQACGLELAAGAPAGAPGGASA